MEALLGIVYLLVVVGSSIGVCVGSIMLIVHGFKKDTSWGLINLLVPFGMFVFMFKYPDEAQPGKKITITSLLLLIATLAVSVAIGSALS
tara:strand:- start:697 stop:966 length:270 start_codon:yes stop_codon:yes gene_type:complete